MPEYRRPSLLTADLVEVSTHLLSKSIKASITYDDTAMLITFDGTSLELTTALGDYVPVAVKGQYRPPLPGDLPVHVAHLASFLAATPTQLAALTQPQRDHALQDVIRVLKALVDDRLG